MGSACVRSRNAGQHHGVGPPRSEAVAPQCLPGPWPKLLAGGQVYTTLILSTSYCDKYRGRLMQPGDAAEVHLPGPGGSSSSWGPRLVRKAGYPECSAFIWYGDEDQHDSSIYVVFSPLRHLQQAAKMYLSPGLVAEELPRGAAACDGAGAGSAPGCQGAATFCMAGCIKHQLAAIWGSGHELGALMLQAAADRPRHRFIFGGISYGAVMAQAAGLRFKLANPAADVNVVTWNSCKWTDAAGSALMAQVFGVKMLALVLSRQKPGAPRYWDSWAGFPSTAGGWSPALRLMLLDADSGIFLPCVSPGNSHFGPHFVRRASELHFAKTAIRATRVAMCGAVGASGDGNGLKDEGTSGEEDEKEEAEDQAHLHGILN